jgi:uncharacterized protein
VNSPTIAIVCKPGSTHPGLVVQDGVLQLRVRERAIEGAANEACINVLSKALRVPRSSVRLIAGARSRQKRFAIEGLDDSDVRLRLGVA